MSIVKSFVSSFSILSQDVKVIIISAERCAIGNICHDKKGVNFDFFLSIPVFLPTSTFIFLSTSLR